jgi:hypothetical protein
MFNDYGHCDGCGHIHCICAPAPKEKEMEHCTKHQMRYGKDEACSSCAAELHAVWEKAYFAALTGQCYGRPNAESIVGAAEEIANATVTAWPAMTAERDALIAKAVQG